MHNYKQSSKERAVNYTGQNRKQLLVAEYLSSNLFDISEISESLTLGD